MSQDDEKRSVTVRIGGEEHVIRASAEPDYTRACARYVDERIQEVRVQAGLIEGHKAVILAAMAMADEVFKARSELDDVRKEVTSRATNLLRRIEGELEAHESAPPDDEDPESAETDEETS